MAETEQSLRAGALSPLAVAALGSVMMGPALGIYANLGVISADAGKVAPAVFIAALLCTLPTAISYALIAREIPSAGGAYAWISKAANPVVGTWIGLLLVVTYFVCIILQPILFGIFFNELLSSFGIATGYGTWMGGVVLSTLVVAAMAYPGIELAATGSLILTIVEAVVVLALGGTVFVILWQHGQVDATPFNPFDSLRGGPGFFHGLVFGLLSFVGFGVIATAAEETESPRSVIPRAMVLACVILGAFWALVSWGFCLALPPTDWGSYVEKGTNPVAIIARQYWHSASLLVIITAITAVLGVYLASVVGYSRVAYAMARDKTLPDWLAQLHPRYRVPWNAQHLAFIASLVVAAIWGHWIGSYKSYDWWGSAVVFFSMVSNIFVSIGCGVFFYRFRPEQANWFWHGLIPVLGVVTSMLPLYYSFGPDLWRSGWANGQSVILFSVLVVAGTALYAVRLWKYKPELLSRASEE